MPSRSDDPTSRLVNVDWDDPRLHDLLKQTEELRLDNRGMFPPRHVLLRPGWHLSTPAFPATLVDEDDHGHLVVVTHMTLDRDAPVMLEKEAGGTPILAEVSSCRHGARDEDRGTDLYILELRARDPHTR